MYDIAVIGGGVNGCGIARDAAGRGLSVLLAEKGDLAEGTSSASTKLIHGGLRYLEHYEFRLVRESLREREVLLKMAPHIIAPLRFILPHHRALRPAPLIRLGLFLYDHLGGREILPGSYGANLRDTPEGEPLKPGFARAFEYSDCRVDDARLVVLNAMDAASRGADIRVRSEAVAAERTDGRWRIQLYDHLTGRNEAVMARALVNAGGPWVARILSRCVGARARPPVRLVKGSHIVVPRLFAHDKAYIFQNADGRVIFAIPYEDDFTLIGTTDVDYDGDLVNVGISPDETVYLCQAASEYFRATVLPASVVGSFAGVRPLYDEGKMAAQEATRDSVLQLEGGKGGAAPLLNIFGGKVTTYRLLAEEALAKLAPFFPKAGRPWTRGAALPGGDFPHDGRERLANQIGRALPFLGPETAARLARTYGALTRAIFANAESMADLGVHFGAGLTEREVRHLQMSEWAVTADDILWRRTKLGLRMTAEEKDRLAAWLAAPEATRLSAQGLG